MTTEQREKCKVTIHSHATIMSAANLVPIPAVGIAADMTGMVTMTMALGAIFGISVTAESAKNAALAAFKRQLAKQAGKQIIKIIPVAGWLISAGMTFALVESVGWEMAARFYRESRENQASA